MGTDSPDEPSEADADRSEAEASRPITAEDESPRERADATPLSPSTAFGLLADERRRYLLFYLQEAGGRADLDDAAEQVAAWENRTTTESLAGEATQRVRAGLHHASIPTLVTHAVVEYDRDGGTISFGENAPHLRPYLAFARDVEDDEVVGGAHPQKNGE